METSKQNCFGIYSILIVLTFIAVFSVPSQVYAYTTGCNYNITYSPEAIRELVLNSYAVTSVRNIPVVPPCTRADKEQLLNDVGVAHRAHQDVLARGSAPDATPAEIAARNAELGQIRAEAPRTPKPLKCDKFWQIFDIPCWGLMISVVISTLFITLSAWFLAVAGVLFNWSLLHTVILFKTSIFDLISSVIDTWWGVLRDASNIVIIGMFVFTAISIILGNKEYGQKRRVATVLVIAVLINFSLLFTKMIIDASNFTAAQFYASARDQTVSQAISSAQAEQARDSATTVSGTVSGINITRGYAQSGIAGEFVKVLGTLSTAETFSALKSAGEKANQWWLPFVHGIFSTVFLLGTAAVLFYGSFLLISRAVLLIFLMLTSALAFASHLIPKISEGIGWKEWWQSLLGSAVLAPILMIFLYVTISIAQQLTTDTDGTQKGTLGGLLSATATNNDIKTLFNYVLILGLLFASFKLASKFSSTIGGFDFVGKAIGALALVPLALGSRFIAAPAGRRLLGGGAAEESLKLDQAIKTESMRAAKARLANKPYTGPLTSLIKQKAKADMRAGRTYDLAGTKLVQALSKAVLPGFIAGAVAGTQKTSYADTAEAKAKKAAEIASALGISKEDARVAAADEAREMRKGRDLQKEQIKVQRDTAAKILERLGQIAEKTNQDEGLGAKHADAKENLTIATGLKTDMKKEQAKEIAQLENAGASKESISAKQTEHLEALKTQDERIKQARSTLQTVEDRIAAIDAPVKAEEIEIKGFDDEMKKLDEDLSEAIKQRMQELLENASKNAQDVAEQIVGKGHEDNYTVQLARGLTKKRIGVKDLIAKRQAEDEELESAGVHGRSPMPPAPSGPPSPHGAPPAR